MSKIISINNRKGGTSKTTTSINLSYGLAKKGYKVLLIDLDPQANSSCKFTDDYENQIGIAEVLAKTRQIKEVINRSSINENLYYITSKIELDDGAERMLLNSQTALLSKLLKEVENEFDFVLIDNNPGISILLKNCVYAADMMILPITVDKNSKKGVDLTLRKIVETIEDSPVPLKVNYRILISMVTCSKGEPTNIAKEFIDAIKGIYGFKVLESKIRLQSKPAQQQTFENSYMAVDYDTNLGEDYNNLVDEIERLFIQ